MRLFREYVLLFVISIFSLPFIGEGDVNNDSDINVLDEQMISIGAGSKRGVYYYFGDNLCRLIYRNSKKMNLKCRVIESLGSPDNISMLKNGKIDLALSQLDWVNLGFYGSADVKTNLVNPNLRFVMSLYDEDLAIITRRDSKIFSLDDLKGKNISSGSSNNSINLSIALKNLLKLKNWTAQDFQGIVSIKLENQALALCNKEVDALVIVSGTPSDVILDASKSCEINILPIDSSLVVNNANKEINSLHPSTILPGIYPGINQPVQTLAVRSILVTNSTVSDSTIYNVVKVIIENIDSFRRIGASFMNLDANRMANEFKSIPLHPGAEKYFKEKGLIK